MKTMQDFLFKNAEAKWLHLVPLNWESREDMQEELKRLGPIYTSGYLHERYDGMKKGRDFFDEKMIPWFLVNGNIFQPAITPDKVILYLSREESKKCGYCVCFTESEMIFSPKTLPDKCAKIAYSSIRDIKIQEIDFMEEKLVLIGTSGQSLSFCSKRADSWKCFLEGIVEFLPTKKAKPDKRVNEAKIQNNPESIMEELIGAWLTKGGK